MIGLVGKPSAGKSTFFYASTLIPVKIADYPFTTIDPNVGTTYVRVHCPHTEIGTECNPRKGFCKRGERFVPVEITDIAGLVEGAHEGRGMGNRFLDEIRQKDVLVIVVDASGRTDLSGNPGKGDPVKEVEIVLNEYRKWLEDRLEDLRKRYRGEKLVRALSGLGISGELAWKVAEGEKGVEDVLEEKSTVIAANKVDVEGSEEHVERLRERYENVVPVSALAEVILRKAAEKGYIEYLPGDRGFEVLKDLTEEQRKALKMVERVLERWGSTGVQEVLNRAVLSKYVVVFPVRNEFRWTDSEGRVLPDAILVPRGSTVVDVAYAVHTDIGERLKTAVDARTKKMLPRDYRVETGDVIKFVV